jgi:ABC-type Zn uptake system ZnuABC Zn-binding protein ZnuA
MTDRARLNYLNDTLLGPIAKSIDCEVIVTPITPGAFQVQVRSPVPDDLHKAHSLTIFLATGERLIGTVAHARKAANGDLEFQIDV